MNAARKRAVISGLLKLRISRTRKISYILSGDILAFARHGMRADFTENYNGHLRRLQ